MRIPLRRAFQIIPEGEHVFYIESVDADEKFGKLKVNMVTKEGLKHTERFSLLDNKGNWNDGALNAFSYFAQTATNQYGAEDIDPVELVGCYIKAEVTHTVQPNRNDPTKTVTFVNLGNKYPADCFEDGTTATLGTAEQPTQETQPTQPTQANNMADLMALLNS